MASHDPELLNLDRFKTTVNAVMVLNKNAGKLSK